jgi:CubicO group peptidase (beta-lactamase class C family)
MKKIFLLPFLLIVLVIHAQQPALRADMSTYINPTFTDTSRITRVKAMIPVIDRIYRDYAQQKHFPAIAFGIVVDDQLVYAGSYGKTDIAKAIPASPSSLFRIASMTKSFTGMAILRLRDEGKLRLDDPAALYIPELKKVSLLTSDAPPVTIRNLLTHTAGFPEDNPWGDRQLAITEQQFSAMLQKGISFSNVPGIQYEYSNMGWAMLGRIITRVAGKPYEQYITENILRPLGMDHTVWEYTKVSPAKLAHGYRYENDQWKEEALLHDGVYGAMGGIITSVEDFSKYMMLHLAAWPPRNGKETGPVKRSSIREMQQPWSFNNLDPSFRYRDSAPCPLVSSYGYGLRTGMDCNGRKYVGHTGGLPGFGSQWWIMPDYGIGVVALGNLTYASMTAANYAVLDTLIKGAKLLKRPLPVSSVLQQRQSEIAALLPDWKAAEQSGIFAINFFADHSLAGRKEKSAALFAKAGKIQRIGEVVPENQLRGVFDIVCENATVEVYFTLTPEYPALVQYLDMELK